MPDLTPEERKQIFLEEMAKYQAQSIVGRRPLAEQIPKKHGGGWYAGMGCLGLIALYILIAIVMSISPDSSRVTQPSGSTAADYIIRRCDALYKKPVSQLSKDDLDFMNGCEALNYGKH
jgi:hypothetical protein